MNLKEILIKKAQYPVRLIAVEEGCGFSKGDEIGIEAIDFSCGNIRCSNKEKSLIFELYYNKRDWELDGNWIFKKRKVKFK